MASDERALELAVGHLGKRERTAAEIRRHLAGKDVGEPAAEAAVAELERMGYLDDERYARAFAEDRRTLDDWGPQRIERRLLELGIDCAHVAAALGQRDGDAELEAAIKLLHRRCRAVPSSERERERALGMLMRKGYDLELAYDAVRAFERRSPS
ncbi:MAG TPA: RecX family transcriptional regulator [Solirubrobacteraceae bacterium]|nr:RecX family transcriptional regulator [Solirubrobacteraceae bacterium]